MVIERDKLGQLLKELRGARNQATFASELGLPASSGKARISAYETGKAAPPESIMEKLDITVIYRAETEPKPRSPKEKA